MEDRQPRDEELLRFRAEAAALLGEERPPADPKEKGPDGGAESK